MRWSTAAGILVAVIFISLIYFIISAGCCFYSMLAAYSVGNPDWMHPGAGPEIKFALGFGCALAASAAVLAWGLATGRMTLEEVGHSFGLRGPLRARSAPSKRSPPTAAQEERGRRQILTVVSIAPVILVVEAERWLRGTAWAHRMTRSLGRFEILGMHWSGFELLLFYSFGVFLYLRLGGPLPRIRREKD